MARLVVVASPALADGFRLAGCASIPARPGGESVAAIRGLTTAGDVGLVLVTADLWTSLEAGLRGRLERLARPVVLPIPAGVVADPSTRRQLLDEMLERAIGYRIELAGETARGTTR